MTESGGKKQLLHLVFGGELENLSDVQFRDLKDLDIVGIFPGLRLGADGLERQGAIDGGQRAYALLHRPYASLARSRRKRPEASDFKHFMRRHRLKRRCRLATGTYSPPSIDAF